MANRVELGPGYYPLPDIGRPVSNGKIYVGIVDLDPEIPANQKQLSVMRECGEILEVPQPIPTSKGGVPTYNGSPVTILVEGPYSLKVLDRHDSQVYYVPFSAEGTDKLITVKTIDDLRNTTGSFQDQSLNLLGYYTAGDGGGGPTRIWDEGQAPGFYIDNGGSIIVPNGGDGSAAWVAKEPILSINEFGGIDDGITNNDTVFNAIQGANDVIEIPGGNYITTVTLTKRFFGNGKINGIPVPRVGQTTTDTIVGYDAGKNILSDDLEATMYGRGCGRELTTGIRNTGIGQGVFSGDTLKTAGPWPVTGTNNVGVGFHALKKMRSGSLNIGIGTDAGNEITTGESNTCVGGSAGQQLTISFGNTMVGRAAGLRAGLDASSLDPDTYVDLNSAGNTCVGRDAGRNLYDGSNNTYIGNASARGTKDESDLTGNNTGDFNVAIGYHAMYTNPVSATNNVVMGSEAARDLSTGVGNVIIGHQAARAAEGSGNIIIGNTAYRSATTADNKFVVSNQTSVAFLDGDMAGPLSASNILTIDALIRPGNDGVRDLGQPARRLNTIYATNNTINTSDENEKNFIEDIPLSWLEAAKNIRPKRFKFNNAVVLKGDSARWHVGYIAQQVFEALDNAGIEDPWECAFLCKDALDDELLDGTVVPIIDESTGLQKERWGLRYSELLVLKMAAL